MRVTLGLVGSRGDVAPGLVLAEGLRERGHDVRVGVAPNLVGQVAGASTAEVVPLGVDSRDLLTSELVRERMRSRDPRVRLTALREVAVHGWDELRYGLVDLADDADVVVTGLLGQEVGSAVAERVGAAFAALHYAPVRANAAVPLLGRGHGPRTVRTTWRLGERIRWDLTRPGENRQRRALGLAPAVVDLPQRLRERGALEIQAYDPVLVPGLAAQWGPRRPVVGYLRPGADRARPEDPELDAALAEGAVLVGFGSMPVPDPDRLLEALDTVATRLGVRVVWTSGWSETAAGTSRVLVRREVDHDAVLPRCLAAVHHGGAGTTGAVLRAGVPQVVCWWSADQPMWGRQVQRAGLGHSLAFARLDADRLTTALEGVLGTACTTRAREAAARTIDPAAALAASVELLERAC